MTNTLRNFIAWVPILCLLLVLWLPQAIKCMPINPGGEELVCRYEYASTGVKFAFELSRILTIVSFLASIYFATNRQLSRAGLAGLLVSALLAISLVMLKLYIGVEDYP